MTPGAVRSASVSLSRRRRQEVEAAERITDTADGDALMVFVLLSSASASVCALNPLRFPRHSCQKFTSLPCFIFLFRRSRRNCFCRSAGFWPGKRPPPSAATRTAVIPRRSNCLDSPPPSPHPGLVNFLECSVFSWFVFVVQDFQLAREATVTTRDSAKLEIM